MNTSGGPEAILHLLIKGIFGKVVAAAIDGDGIVEEVGILKDVA